MPQLYLRPTNAIPTDVAKRTSELLRNGNAIPSSLPEEINSVTKGSFPLPVTAGLVAQLSELDSLGCELWNAATNILRSDENAQDPRLKHDDHAALVSSLRVFAYFLLDTAHRTSSKRTKDRDQDQRVFKIALKTCRFCVEKGEMALSNKVLERCVEYVSAANDDSPLVRISNNNEDGEHRAALAVLITEFYLLRIMYSWKDQRFDLAEHHFNQISSSQLSATTSLAEKAADLFYEIGKYLLRRKLEDSAIMWLDRAISILDTCDLEGQNQDTGDLRLGITTSLGQCCSNVYLSSSMLTCRS